MIRQNQRFLTQIYVLSDAFIMLLVFMAAYWVKFHSGWITSYNTLPMSSYLLWGTVYAFASVLIGFSVGFYAPRRRKSFASDVWNIVQVHSLSFLGLLSMLYIAKQVHISREFLAIFFGANIAVMISYRYMVKTWLFRLRRKGYNKKYVLILGAGSVGRSFYENLQQYPELGYDVFGFLDDYHVEHPREYRHMKPIVGKIDELEKVLNENRLIDEVIIALPLEAHSKYPRIIDICDNAGVKTLIIPDFFDLLPARPFFDNFAGIPLINVRDIPLDELSNRILKRTFDIVFSIMAIIVTSPVMLLIVAGIKLTSPGPVIFKQERMGLNRRTFNMYKFRTMHVSPAEVSDTQWTVENDPRRTKFGAFLRRTSLDELPQFFNVLLGHMSVVGPRPERPYFVDQFKEEIPKYMVKHHIRPGITGWAQTNGLRGDTSIHDRIRHDLFYIENWSFLFDLKIIVKTVVNGLVNKNAY
ncbi:undecaprenyl-phosphate glucose phosphotransferase [Paenibacillus cisolokensis]|uniref:undecaprenyl-phosphate glucose phosphotransferase n=1 Tax=Paenibacillus cisolokensis TaxID=1658519 RepID=UPI003D29B90A